ncbi:MAG: FliC/FljB family flagellin [Pseudomonadota bacterium]|nr:FliC/FljB family flagellin [Pseudomonadota bacterium]
MSVINTNITAMIGQQNLGKSQSALQTSMERLSSGLRINSAADDAAGQAIANRMTAQTTGLAQAQRNANDGISVAQTAEGALNQVNDNLQRIRELTVQAENGTNSAEDLSSIQDEINQRLGEIDRISEETNFNGVKVLAEDQELSIQVGANDGEQITMNLKGINAETLGLDSFSVAASIDPTSVDTSAAVTTARVGETLDVAIDADSTSPAATADGLYESADSSTGYVVKSGTDYYEATVEATDTGGDGSLNVTWDSSSTAIGTAPGGSEVTELASEATVSYSGSESVYAYNGTEAGAPAYVLEGNDADGNTVYYEAEIATDGTVSKGSQLSTDPATDNPLAALDSALSSVDSLRSELGAMQNRFDSAITNLSTTETNLSAARSRIEDADYAVEVSNMTRAQILQQAGTSVLAQANQVPQSVLSLLG